MDNKKKSPNFLVGFIIGTLLVLIYWYWNKSTTAEDGALDMLNRYARSEARVRELEAEVETLKHQAAADAPVRPMPAAPGVAAKSASTPPQPAARRDDLREIEGIGPTYAKRLADAGIASFADLAALSPERVRELTRLPATRAAEAGVWIETARRLAR